MHTPATTRRRTYRILGVSLWLATLGLILGSAWSVHARAARRLSAVVLVAPEHHRLRPGDIVYATTPSGMRRIGEVSRCGPAPTHVELAIHPPAFARLTTASTASCWRTPLSAEETIETLLPPDVQQAIATCIAADWQAREAALLEIWRPLITELAQAYVTVIGAEVERVLYAQRDEIADVSSRVASQLSAHWPAIQRQLNPILQQHLTPVLSRLMDNALDQAPKARIAWHIYRNNSAEALRIMLDWLGSYLADLTPHDREALARALHRTWGSAVEDAALGAALDELGRALAEDEELRGLLRHLYEQAIADNPRTAEFVRTQIIESPTIRAEIYRLLEWFGPTARQVARIILFEDGYTRPEVVHLLRSAALQRKISWVTLDTPQRPADPLDAGATLTAQPRGRLLAH